VSSRVAGEAAFGAQLTANLSLNTTLFAASLVDWATEIELEDRDTSGVPWEGDDWEALEPQVRQLLTFMHGREDADLGDLCPVVWGKDYADVTEAARETTTSKANNFLNKRESLRMLRKVRGEPRLRWMWPRFSEFCPPFAPERFAKASPVMMPRRSSPMTPRAPCHPPTTTSSGT
jgi:hypothetical protein